MTAYTTTPKEEALRAAEHCSTIKEAIGRSISHNEIALVIVDDIRAALEAIDNDENVSDFDHSTENNGDVDAWGTRLDREFRIRIRQS